MLLMMAVLLNTQFLRAPDAGFTTDCIAILADKAGDVKPTTLGSGEARALRLQWSPLDVPDDQPSAIVLSKGACVRLTDA